MALLQYSMQLANQGCSAPGTSRGDRSPSGITGSNDEFVSRGASMWTGPISVSTEVIRAQPNPAAVTAGSISMTQPARCSSVAA
ncbi:hypothetical protein IU486_17195 [Streptomyces gardneri]|nr:hypothetical protein [Streptomyces gardneri]MBF6205259.1 hypothetical protein [Streptomyces gardneri]